MKTIFNNSAKCVVCGSYLYTPNDRKIGDNFYCATHYQQEIEKPVNERKKELKRKLDRLFEPYEEE